MDDEAQIIEMRFEETLDIRGALPVHKTPVASEESNWDGPTQVRNATTDDLRVMSAWVDASAPDVKSSYKLPHHEADGLHRVVWRGVAAAMGIMMGARGGVDIPDADRQAVYNHLATHYRQFDKEPPSFKEMTDSELASMGVYSMNPSIIENETKNEGVISNALQSLVWPSVASAMYAVLNDVTTTDETRKRVYVGLQRLYSVLDQVPPDFVSRKTVEKLTKTQRDGMFWSGEDVIAVKAGRTLSMTNEQRLRQSVELIGYVLDSVDKPETGTAPYGEPLATEETVSPSKDVDASLDVDLSVFSSFLSKE
jgi:hypothetical protein